MSAHEIEHVRKFAASKARQFADQAFGDSRVEDAARVLEDIAAMLERVELELAGGEVQS